MKLKASISKLLTNKMVLYTVFGISLLNILGYMVMGNLNALLYFILIGFLASLFSKNYIIILIVPLILVNLIYLLRNNSVYEAMTTQSDKSSDKKSTEDKNNSKTKDKKPTTSKQGLPITPLDHTDNTDSSKMNENTEESFEVGRGKKGTYNIDYAATVEDAYDQLNSIIGSDGIKRLTSDTQNLMQQQLQLTKAMEGMQPLIKNMKPLLENMGPLLDQAKGLMGTNGSSLTDMAKKFSASMPSTK
jgi:hypothetical protein